jgi:hypothetical protein
MSVTRIGESPPLAQSRRDVGSKAQVSETSWTPSYGA